MTTTYKVEAKCNRTEGINVEFKGVATISQALLVAHELQTAFPQIDVICEQTGEVMFNIYVAIDLYEPTEPRGKAIYLAECELYV